MIIANTKPELSPALPAPANDAGYAFHRSPTRRSIAVRYLDDGPTDEFKRRTTVIVNGERHRLGWDWNGHTSRDKSDWPAARELRKQDNPARLAAAERYRALTQRAHQSVSLSGSPLANDNGLSIEQRVWNRPDGETENKGARLSQAKAAEPLPAHQAQSIAGLTDGENARATRTRRVTTKWNGDDPIHAWLDANRQLTKAHALLGPIHRTIDDLLLHDLTLRAVGEKLGINNSIQASGAAMAILNLGLDVLAAMFEEADAEDGFKANRRQVRIV